MCEISVSEGFIGIYFTFCVIFLPVTDYIFNGSGAKPFQFFSIKRVKLCSDFGKCTWLSRDEL